jgi:hypothetical protein
MKIIVIAAALLALTSGCATHGPFVRNLAKGDGDTLTYQECYLYIDGFWGNSETKDCKDKTIKLK